MSEWCTHCHEEMGFPGKADINVQEKFEQLDINMFWHVLCEGCGMGWIANLKGKLKVRYLGKNEWVDYKFR